MVDENITENPREYSFTEFLKGWVMAVLTLIFIFLYGAALFGWLKPLTDITMVARLEPIIFVIIGYYFGRLPAQQNEKTLKDEINRQTQKTDTLYQVNEQVLQDKAVLKGKIQDALTALKTSSLNSSPKSSNKEISLGSEAFNKNNGKSAVEAAINILDS